MSPHPGFGHVSYVGEIIKLLNALLPDGRWRQGTGCHVGFGRVRARTEKQKAASARARTRNLYRSAFALQYRDRNEREARPVFRGWRARSLDLRARWQDGIL